MKVIYENSTGQYRVYEDDKTLFSDQESTMFFIAKYDKDLAQTKESSGYWPINSFKTLNACYKWLKEYGIISKDEYKFLIGK